MKPAQVPEWKRKLLEKRQSKGNTVTDELEKKLQERNSQQETKGEPPLEQPVTKTQDQPVKEESSKQQEQPIEVKETLKSIQETPKERQQSVEQNKESTGDEPLQIIPHRPKSMRRSKTENTKVEVKTEKLQSDKKMEDTPQALRKSVKATTPVTQGKPTVNAKLICLGESGTGKSSIIEKLVNDIFRNAYVATIGADWSKKEFKLKEAQFVATIWDTAGQERFRNVTAGCYRDVNGVVFVFDVSNRASFEGISFWIADVKEKGNTKYGTILCGNKADLEVRAVSTQEGQALADKFGMKYFETSAKEGTNIQTMFETLLADAYKLDPEMGTRGSLKKLPIEEKQKQQPQSSGCC
ncbi:hypothetical protein EIN_250160 [Entamoeba invadens IP1]|uniref:Uncharacterized protein n=1 Tax=Entamoeba invadens IP1 TaxID=370355 RepID=A0A0A1UH93_ENTIV|nr:hypothetical protein EIN_250160 [Entamoeba invadens IP1]ELP94922.1 hypothetical protein EIN_250160 [Entamoeba invadens IP1]|eukprot:XP_004261693.1 hypothetical protein EIN_250160 [Entamoeba invadens IP1]